MGCCLSKISQCVSVSLYHTLVSYSSQYVSNPTRNVTHEIFISEEFSFSTQKKEKSTGVVGQIHGIVTPIIHFHRQ